MRSCRVFLRVSHVIKLSIHVINYLRVHVAELFNRLVIMTTLRLFAAKDSITVVVNFEVHGVYQLVVHISSYMIRRS